MSIIEHIMFVKIINICAFKYNPCFPITLSMFAYLDKGNNDATINKIIIRLTDLKYSGKNIGKNLKAIKIATTDDVIIKTKETHC